MNQKNTRQATAHIPPFGLRMQPALKERIEEEARKNNRSLNAEIVSRLEDSLGVEGFASEVSELSGAEQEKAIALIAEMAKLFGMDTKAK